VDLELFFVAQVRGLGELAIEAFTRFAVFACTDLLLQTSLFRLFGLLYLFTGLIGLSG
jgi:hypothetical protein